MEQRFTHEDRFIMGLFPLLSVILISSKSAIIDIVMTVIIFGWIIYETLITVHFCKNYIETVESIFIGFTGFLGVLCLDKFPFGIILLVIYVIEGIYINAKSLKYARSC